MRVSQLFSGYNAVTLTGVELESTSSGDLAAILVEVNRLRVQLERCVSSNDRLRHTLRKCGSIPTSTDDSCVMSAHRPDGKLV